MKQLRHRMKMGLALGVVATLAAGTTHAQLNFSGSLVASGTTNAKLEVKTHTAVAVTPSGETFAVWQDFREGIGGDILSSKFTGGPTFTQAVRLNDDVESASPDWGWSHGMPDIAAGPEGNVYVVWEDRRDATGAVCPAAARCDSDVFFTYTGNGGLQWSPNMRLHPTVEGSQTQPAIAVDGSGRVHVVWTDTRNGAESADIYYTRSLDAGLTWEPPRQLNSPGESAVQFEPAIAARGERVYVVWSDARTGDYDIYGTQSSDGGVNFIGNVRVNDDTTTMAQRQAAVAVANDGGALVVWRDLRAGYDDADIYLAHNPAGGPAFGANVRVNDDLDPALQSDPSIAVDGAGRAVVVYSDYRNGMNDADIYASMSTGADAPFSFGVSSRVNAGSTVTRQRFADATLDPSTGQVVVAWEHHRRSGGADIKVSHTMP